MMVLSKYSQKFQKKKMIGSVALGLFMVLLYSTTRAAAAQTTVSHSSITNNMNTRYDSKHIPEQQKQKMNFVRTSDRKNNQNKNDDDNNSNFNTIQSFPLRTLTTTTKGKKEEHQRNLQAQEVDALYQGYGTHYVDLWCGTPPQRQTLIVVTGDTPGATGFPCSQCGTTCEENHIDKLFQESLSSTFHSLTCTECINGHCPSHVDQTTATDHCLVGMSYDEGSAWSGYEVQDRCYIGGPHDKPLLHDDNGKDDLDPNHASFFGFDFIFSCQTSISDAFDYQLADGILAMDNSKGSFWYQMYQAGKLGKDQVFSMCFRKQPKPDHKEAEEAGAMTIGGFDKRLHLTPLVRAKLDTTLYPSYSITLRNIYLRAGNSGESVQSMNPNATIQQILYNATQGASTMNSFILDSGYTDTYLASPIYDELIKTWEKFVGTWYTHHSKVYTQTELDSLPTILFQFVGTEENNQWLLDMKQKGSGQAIGLADVVDPNHPNDILVAMPPHHYMENTYDNFYTSRIYSSGQFDKPYKTVVGANFMMGHDIVFDLDNHEVGFAESTCDYTELIEEYYDGELGPPTGDATTTTSTTVSTSTSTSISITAPSQQKEPNVGIGTTTTTQEEVEVIGAVPYGTNDNDSDSICTGRLFCVGPLLLTLLLVGGLGLVIRWRYNNSSSQGTYLLVLPRRRNHNNSNNDNIASTAFANELELTDVDDSNNSQLHQPNDTTTFQYRPPPANDDDDGFQDEPEQQNTPP